MSSTTVSAISVGSVIDGRFQLLRRLGETEWSSAYLTELDDGPPQRAAIKIFPFESVDARATMARWDVARTLSHPHLMPLFYASRFDGECEDMLYVVTEYAEETLSQILPERPLRDEEAREMLGPVLDALTYLHRRSLTHGHLRPTNIMVVDGHLKLSPDFGWRARRRSIYDPPEADSEELTAAADIWSLGILLVECLTQRTPAWDRLEGGEPEVPETIPEPFYTIARECLRVEPAQRCSLARIRTHLNPPEPAAEFDAGPDPYPKPSFQFRAMILGGVFIMILLLISVFMLGFDLTPWETDSAPQAKVAALVAAEAEPAAAAPAQAEVQLKAPKSTAAPKTVTGSKPVAATEATRPKAIAAAPPAAPISVSAPAPAQAQAVAASTDGALKGSVAHQALPTIPGDIIRTIHGHVNVGIRVEVDAKGNVSHASIDSPGPSRYFANKSLEAAPSWKFKPAEVDGRATASTWLLLFQYGPSEVAATPTEETP